jgi:hypothetical protein
MGLVPAVGQLACRSFPLPGDLRNAGRETVFLAVCSKVPSEAKAAGYVVVFLSNQLLAR